MPNVEKFSQMGPNVENLQTVMGSD